VNNNNNSSNSSITIAWTFQNRIDNRPAAWSHDDQCGSSQVESTSRSGRQIQTSGLAHSAAGKSVSCVGMNERASERALAAAGFS